MRPRARSYRDPWLGATPPDKVARWKVGRRTVRALILEGLVEKEQKPGAASFGCRVILDPHDKDPLVLATHLSITAYALFCLYRDRWPIEQVPLAAKQMLGAERRFVLGLHSRLRLPELALFSGNLLTYVAATSTPVASGFWDRCARPTCGRLRRQWLRLDFSELPVPEGQMRNKASVSAHLPKGVKAHRSKKCQPTADQLFCSAWFTGK